MTKEPVPDIEIKTIIPLQDFKDQAALIQAALMNLPIHVELGADTVARTYASRVYGLWFQDNKSDWFGQFGWASYHGDDEWILSDAWENIDTDVRIHWLFDGGISQDRDIALLFKLAHGGS